MIELKRVTIPVSPLLLKQCEAIIDGELENLNKFIRALEVIEQMELYKEQYSDFTTYCQARWKMVIDQNKQDQLTFNLITKDNQ